MSSSFGALEESIAIVDVSVITVFSASWTIAFLDGVAWLHVDGDWSSATSFIRRPITLVLLDAPHQAV